MSTPTLPSEGARVAVPAFLELESINKIRSGSDYILLSKIPISCFQRFSQFHVFMSMDSVAEIMSKLEVSLFIVRYVRFRQTNMFNFSNGNLIVETKCSTNVMHKKKKKTVSNSY